MQVAVMLVCITIKQLPLAAHPVLATEVVVATMGMLQVKWLATAALAS
jgi:hypothetical protein